MASPGSEIGDEAREQDGLDEAVATLNATCANPVATPSPSRGGEVDGIEEFDRVASRGPIPPIISPASIPDLMPISEEEVQGPALDPVSVVPEGSIEGATDAADPSPRQDTQMGDAFAHPSQEQVVPSQAQPSSTVQDQRPITIAPLQIGRAGSASAPVLFGDSGFTVQIRDAPADANAWVGDKGQAQLYHCR